jgi:hypothetical protein
MLFLSDYLPYLALALLSHFDRYAHLSTYVAPYH